MFAIPSFGKLLMELGVAGPECLEVIAKNADASPIAVAGFLFALRIEPPPFQVTNPGGFITEKLRKYKAEGRAIAPRAAVRKFMEAELQAFDGIVGPRAARKIPAGEEFDWGIPAALAAGPNGNGKHSATATQGAGGTP